MSLLKKISAVPRRAMRSTVDHTKKLGRFIKGATTDLFPPENKQKPTIYTCMHEIHAFNKKKAEIQNQKTD